MHRLWRTDEIPGEAAQLLALPRHFEQIADLIGVDQISAPCGPDPAAHLGGIRAYEEAGFDEFYVGRVGPAQDGFFDVYASTVLPRLRGDCRRPQADLLEEVRVLAARNAFR